MQNSGGARPKIMGHSSPNIGMFFRLFSYLHIQIQQQPRVHSHAPSIRSRLGI
jgi:hypothetical protein